VSVVVLTPSPPRVGVAARLASVAHRIREWAVPHRRSLVLCGGLLVVVGVVHAWNMGGWPGQINEDEGTYISQAWAVNARGALAPYTYTYDHPPLGWLTISLWAFLTNAFERADYTLLVGREVMLVSNLLSCGLLYMLARRLQFHRAFAVVAVVAFAFSPLAVHYHRLAFLDNLAVTWLLAALVYAASPRRSLSAALGAGVCFSAAVLTKETTAILLPAVGWLLWQHTTERTRKWSFGVFGAAFSGIAIVYPLYALLKSELLSGPGHVSLFWSIKWQLLERDTSGSLLDPSSDAYSLARSWVDIDPWLFLVGSALTPVGLLVRRLRPIVLAMFIQLAMMCRDGYLPYAYVTAMLPFAALLIGGIADAGWKFRPGTCLGRAGAASVLQRGWRYAGMAASSGAVLGLALLAAPDWYRGLREATTSDRSGAYRAATRWVVENLDHDDTILVDDYIWTDLAQAGFRNHVWYNKAVLDPAVKEEHFPRGYVDADYLVLGELSDRTLELMPIVTDAINYSTVLKDFGGVRVWRVDKPAAATAVWAPTRPDGSAGTRAAGSQATVAEETRMDTQLGEAPVDRARETGAGAATAGAELQATPGPSRGVAPTPAPLPLGRDPGALPTVAATTSSDPAGDARPGGAGQAAGDTADGGQSGGGGTPTWPAIAAVLLALAAAGLALDNKLNGDD
jgi:hypothetical protein